MKHQTKNQEDPREVIHHHYHLAGNLGHQIAKGVDLPRKEDLQRKNHDLLQLVNDALLPEVVHVALVNQESGVHPLEAHHDVNARAVKAETVKANPRVVGGPEVRVEIVSVPGVVVMGERDLAVVTVRMDLNEGVHGAEVEVAARVQNSLVNGDKNQLVLYVERWHLPMEMIRRLVK
jgi:hypothetical protein